VVKNNSKVFETMLTGAEAKRKQGSLNQSSKVKSYFLQNNTTS